jgi:hypothetical protein
MYNKKDAPQTHGEPHADPVRGGVRGRQGVSGALCAIDNMTPG